MADRTIKFEVKTNIADVLKQQTQLSVEIIRATQNIDKLGVEGTKALGVIEKQAKQVEQALNEIDTASETIISTFVPFGGVITSNFQKMEKLADAFKKVEKAGGFTQVLQTYLGRMTTNVQAVGASMNAAFGSGLQGMLAMGKAGLASLLPALGAIATTLLPLLPVILLVGAAIFTLQRMWANNIGGMQTYFHRFIAAIKQAWSLFTVHFDMLLRKLSPLFKVLFSAVFTPLINSVKLLSMLLGVVFKILAPVFDLVGELGAVVGELFGMFSAAQGSTAGMKELGAVLGVIGDVLGFIVRMAIAPFMMGLRVLGVLIRMVTLALAPVGDLLGAVFDSGILKPFTDALQVIYDMIMAVVSAYTALVGEQDKQMSAMEKSVGIGGAKGGASGIAAGMPVSASQVMYNQQRSNTVNNNQSIAVHSGGAISPDSAPFIGDIIAKMISSQVKV